jgi:hypothetical protein
MESGGESEMALRKMTRVVREEQYDAIANIENRYSLESFAMAHCVVSMGGTSNEEKLGYVRDSHDLCVWLVCG